MAHGFGVQASPVRNQKDKKAGAQNTASIPWVEVVHNQGKFSLLSTLQKQLHRHTHRCFLGDVNPDKLTAGTNHQK